MPTKDVINKIKSGDRSIPKKLINWINRNQNKLDDTHEIVCGCGTGRARNIAFIYITDHDTHYFFDIE